MNTKGPKSLSCNGKLFLRLGWSRAGLLLLTDEVSSPKPPLSFRHLAGEETWRLLTHVHYLRHQMEAQPESDGRPSIHRLQAKRSSRHLLPRTPGRPWIQTAGPRLLQDVEERLRRNWEQSCCSSGGKTGVVQTPEPEVSRHVFRPCPSMRRTTRGSSQEGRHVLSEQRLPQE